MPLATPEELLRYPPPPLPDWVVRFNLLPSPEYQIQFLNPPSKGGKPGNPYWVSNYGPQTWALMTPFDETLIGGERGGSKSACLIAWFAMGDPSLTPDDPARYSYLLEPTYRGLILRKEYQALAEFVDEAEEFFGPLGGKRRDDPAVFTFKSGAKIYTNHLGDDKAFEKYRGQGITRIGIEELTQVEKEGSYKKLLGSLRAKRQIRIYGDKQFRALRSQIMSTTNPDGPGASWVKKRFVKVLNSKGDLIPPNTAMRAPSLLTRVFIPMSKQFNPYLRNNKQYQSMIDEQDEVTRRQWLGDWDVGSGVYFTSFRPHGPVTSEEREKYPRLRHVVDPLSVTLKPWWYRWGGGDYGFDHPAAYHKLCRSEVDGRIHIYDEMKMRHVGAFEQGVRVAHWWLPDLEHLPDKSITIVYSHEAFHKEDSGPTKADQFSSGIKSVLGPYGAFIMKFNDEERFAMERDAEFARQMFERRKADRPAGTMTINVKASSRDRSGGHAFMLDLLRFWRAVTETEDELKARLMETFGRAKRDGGGEAAIAAYETELAKVRRPVDGALPKLLIWNVCTGLIRCMEEATRDPDHPEEVLKVDAVDGLGGDDELDSARVAIRDFREVEKVMPRIYYVSEKMEKIQDRFTQDTGERLEDINRLIQVQRRQEAIYDGTFSKSSSFTPARASSSRHRVAGRRGL